MKKPIIIAGVIIVIALGIIAFLSLTSNPQPQPAPKVYPIAPLPSPSTPAGDTTTLTTPQGPLTVNNFYKTANKTIEATVFLADLPDYSIVYFSNTNQFLINLNAYTAADALKDRQMAEANLLKILGITKTQSCQLTLHEAVPFSYNESLSTADYGLSFCPNSLPIPGVDNGTQLNASQPIR